MGDGSSHGDDLLGLLLLLDVVGPQGDVDGAAREQSGQGSVGSQDTALPRNQEGQVTTGVGRTGAEGHIEVTDGSWILFFSMILRVGALGALFCSQAIS